MLCVRWYCRFILRLPKHSNGEFLIFNNESGAFSGLDKKAIRYLEVNPKEDMDVELIYTYLQDAIDYNDEFPNMKFGQTPNR